MLVSNQTLSLGWLALCLSLWGAISATALAEVEEVDRVAAIVEEDIVLESEVQNRIAQYRRSLSAQRITQPSERVMRERALDELVSESIQLQLAERLGIRVGDSDLNQTMGRIAEANNLSLDEFEAALQAEGLSYAEAREKFRREMITSRLQQRMVDARVRVTDKEVQDYLKSMAGRESSGEEFLLAHILLALSDGKTEKEQKSLAKEILGQADDGVPFDELAVRFSDAGTAMNGGDLGWRKGSELPGLFASVVPSMETGDISQPLVNRSGVHLVKLVDRRGGVDQVVSQVLVRHILIQVNTLTTEEQAAARAESLYRQIQEGEDFGQLAEAYSDDSVSAGAGGKMEWISPGETVPIFEQEVFSEEPGAIVAPFRSPFGWHIVEVLDKREQDIGTRVQTQQARQILHRRKFEEERRNWLTEIRDEAYVQVKL